MKQFLFAAAAFVLTGALVASAQDAKPAQPDPARPKAAQPRIQPVQPRPVAVTAARMAQLEEDVESLEAHREVKKAHVRAAEVGVLAATARSELLEKASKGGSVGATEAMTAKFDLAMAKAQLEIRAAELKEVEVKVKFAKKRLEDAKAAGVRPAPGVRPVPVDPKATDPLPPVRFADPEELAALKEKLAKAAAEKDAKVAAVKKADAQVKAAEAELKRVLDIAARGRVAAGTIEKAEAKVKEAKEQAEKLAKEQKELETKIADLEKKLKEIGK